MRYPNEYLTVIHELLNQHFNLEELRTLCFDLGEDYENLGGSGKAAEARELVLYLNRRERIPELEAVVRRQRPEIAWPEPAASKPRPPDPQPAAGVQLAPDDFEQLIAILQGLPQFATPDRRIDFLYEVFQGSPRQSDILGRFDVNGMPRAVAIRLVKWLVQFGQDEPGRETLGLLVQKVLGSVGEGTNAEFLRGLLARYRLVADNSGQAASDPGGAKENEGVVGGPTSGAGAAQPIPRPTITPPQRGKDFLQPDDRRWLARRMGELGNFQFFEGRRNLLIDSDIPRQWIGQINLDRGGSADIAKTVINDLEVRGHLPDEPQKHALGSLLQTLAIDSFGYDDAVKAVALIFRYQLNDDQEERAALSERFGVPLPAGAEEVYEAPGAAPRGTLPAGLQRAELEKNLEALHHQGRANWLDVEFLEAGARAARSVCRLEWGKRGEGTGFLIAPDLVLTNYHVITRSGAYAAAERVQERLANCEVRFGVTGRESAGKRVAGLHEEALVQSSEELDYALLRLREPVEDGEGIVRAALSRETVREEQPANIIQHPLRGAMQVALRNNQIVALRPQRVYYLSDTEQGSSGSPVFDDRWQVIALHRAGGLKDERGEVMLAANEGVPILDLLVEIEVYLTGGM